MICKETFSGAGRELKADVDKFIDEIGEYFSLYELLDWISGKLSPYEDEISVLSGIGRIGMIMAISAFISLAIMGLVIAIGQM